MTEKHPLESAVVRDIMKALKADGYPVWKINGNGYQTKGLPDLITIDAHGRFVGLEVKRPKPSGYGATALQVATLRAINAAGGFGCIVRSVEGARRALVLSEGYYRIDEINAGGDLEMDNYRIKPGGGESD